MTVDVVAEQRRRLLGDHAQTSVRQKARLDQRLETVADAQDQASAVGQSVDFVANILIVQHIDNEFGASVGFVARRETACEHEDVRPADMLLHFGDRAQNVVAGDVAQDARPDLGPRRAERLGGVVVAVRAGEHRNIDHRGLDRLAGINERFRGGCGGHHLRRVPALVGVNGREFLRIGLVKLFERHLHPVDRQRLLGDGEAQQFGMRIFQRALALDEDRTVGVFIQFRLVEGDLRADAVAESHLGKALSDAAEAHGPRREDFPGLDPPADERKVLLQLRRVGHPVLQRSMADEVNAVSCAFEVGGNDL